MQIARRLGENKSHDRAPPTRATTSRNPRARDFAVRSESACRVGEYMFGIEFFRINSLLEKYFTGTVLYVNRIFAEAYCH